MSNRRSGEPDPRAAADGCCPRLLSSPPEETEAVEYARVFKALGDPVRLRLLSMIASHNRGGEVCVCHLTPAFDVSQPTISHHLKLLREAGLIASERRGTWVYYRLLPEATDRLASILTRIPADETARKAGADRGTDPAATSDRPAQT